MTLVRRNLADAAGQRGRLDVVVFVLVGGWPASGKTTLARALAAELKVAYLSKDVVKEALMDGLGAPSTVDESHELGVAAVTAVLRTARGCPGAVSDSTWTQCARRKNSGVPQSPRLA